MKVVFLDFDGVIVTAHTRFNSGDPYCVHCLNEVTSKTGAKIVVSSTWRFGRTVDELKAELAGWGVTGEVIDRTPVDHNVIRGVEIERWIAEHQVESFVILDDDSDMGELLSRLVRTDAIHGMEGKHVKRAIEMLTISSPATGNTYSADEGGVARKE